MSAHEEALPDGRATAKPSGTCVNNNSTGQTARLRVGAVARQGGLKVTRHPGREADGIINRLSGAGMSWTLEIGFTLGSNRGFDGLWAFVSCSYQAGYS
jgi:hypothetical protein